MSKFAKLLKRVKILEEGNIVSTRLLAETLDVSERMIRKYTDDIKEAGLPLKSKPGPNGGLYFEKQLKE